MSDGTEQDEDVPDGVVVGPFVVGKEVGACGVGDAFGNNKPERQGRQELYHRFGDKDDAPSHNEIDGEREPGPTAKGYNLIHGSGNDKQPLQGEDRPAEPAAHYADEDWRIGTGYHDVDADVVALAQRPLQASFVHPMIGRAAEEHEEHAEEEADDAEQHLPARVGCQPNEPDGAQREDRSAKVRPGVALLSLLGPKPLRLHFVSAWIVPRMSVLPMVLFVAGTSLRCVSGS